MSTAIHTRYSGSKIIASADRGAEKPYRLHVPYPHELPNGAKHPFAARRLAEKMGWGGVWVIGHNGDGGTVAVRLPAAASLNAVGALLGEEGEDWFYVRESGK